MMLLGEAIVIGELLRSRTFATGKITQTYIMVFLVAAFVGFWVAFLIGRSRTKDMRTTLHMYVVVVLALLVSTAGTAMRCHPNDFVLCLGLYRGKGYSSTGFLVAVVDDGVMGAIRFGGTYLPAAGILMGVAWFVLSSVVRRARESSQKREEELAAQNMELLSDLDRVSMGDRRATQSRDLGPPGQSRASTASGGTGDIQQQTCEGESPESAESTQAPNAQEIRDSGWFVKFGKRTSRELAFEKLRRLYRVGNVDKDTLVRMKGAERWSRICEIPGLTDELSEFDSEELDS